jgi:hypothetical protein
MLWKTSLESVTLSGLHPCIDGSFRLKPNPDAIAIRWISAAEQHLTWQQRQKLLEQLCLALALDPETVFAQHRFRLLNEQDIGRCRHFDLDIQLHTHRHTLPVDSLDAAAPEVNENRMALERAKLAQCTHLCYPSGMYTPEHANWLPRLGLDSATTCDAGLNTPATSEFLLKRHLDRDDASNIEFEAEICGVTEIARSIRAFLTGSGELKAEASIA